MPFILTLIICLAITETFKIPPLIGVGAALYFHFRKKTAAYTTFNHNFSQEVPATFHHHCFSLMGFLAKADGIITPQEIQITQDIIRDIGMNYTQAVLAKKSFKQGSRGLNLANITHYLNMLKVHQPQLVLRFFEYQERIIHADNIKSLNQINILNQIKFHVLNTQHKTYSGSRQHQPTFASYGGLSDAYKTLGLNKNMPFSEMKKAYRRLVGKHHPDRKQCDESKKQANELIKKIQIAWKVVEQHHAKERAT